MNALWVGSIFVSLVLGYVFGFYVRDLWDKLRYLQRRVKDKTFSKNRSTIIEPPLTPAERLAREQEELLESLNP